MSKGALYILLLHVSLVLIAVLVYRDGNTLVNQTKMADDPCSLSNPHEVVVNHWHLVATPNFSTKKLAAVITVNATVKSDTASTLVRIIFLSRCSIVL